MSKREKALLSILFIIVVGYVYYHFLFAPIQIDIDTLNQENQNMKVSIRKAEQVSGDQGSTNTESKRIKEEYMELASRVPAQPCIPELTVYLEKIAVESGMSLVAVDYRREDNSRNSTKETSQPDGLMTATFDIMLQGDYDSLQGFITKLEKESPRIYNVRRMNVTRHYSDSSKSYDANHLKVDMKMEAYYDNMDASEVTNIPNEVAPGEGCFNPFLE